MKTGSIISCLGVAVFIGCLMTLNGCGPGSFVRALVDDDSGGHPALLPASLQSPTGLTGTPVSGSAVSLNWIDNAEGELGIEVERSTDQENFSLIGTADPDSTTYEDSDSESNAVEQDTSYYYRIRTIGSEDTDGAYSEYSETAPARTLLHEPTAFTANAVTNKLILLSWETNETAGDLFQIDRSLDNSSFDQIAEIPVDPEQSSNTYHDESEFLQDTTYYYRIRATSKDNESRFTHLEDGKYPTTPGPNASFYVPDDFATIQEAIEQSGSGDLILVRPGTYQENLDFLGKNITLESCGGPSVTVIDGGRMDRVVQFVNEETSFAVLEGFTITNGDANEGAGIACIASSPMLKGNRILDNQATTEGGGIFCSSGAPTIIGNVILNNRVSGFLSLGGGISLNSAAAVIRSNRIEDNLVSGNLYSQGGGIYCNATSTLVIESNIIKNNIVTGGFASCFGGGIDCHGATANVTGNCIIGNRASGAAGQGGGIFCLGAATVKIYNNLFSENNANLYGGAIFCSESSPEIYNNTIVDNRAGTLGGGLGCIVASSKPIVRNTIFWANQGDPGAEQIGLKEFLGALPDPDVQFCDVEGGWAGTGNIDADPLFLDIAGANYHLTNGSPCKNAGTNDVAGALPDVDIDGEPRKNATLEIGMDESHTYPTGEYRVPQQYVTIQSVLDTTAQSGETIVVAHDVANGGPYMENINFNGLAVTITSTSGPESTTLDGQQLGPVATFELGEGNDAVLEGFTVTNGLSTAAGGGIYCANSSPTLNDNIITGNAAATQGGGIYCGTALPVIENNSFYGNLAPLGGGIYFDASDPTVTGNTFCGNLADSGAGIFCDGSNPAIVNNALSANEAGAGGMGGAIYCQASSPEIRNNTFLKNKAGLNGGGLFVETPSAPTLINCLLWNNLADSDPQLADADALAAVRYCDIEDIVWPGDGNISADPKFAAMVDGEMLLRQDPVETGILNPCVDAGDPSSPLIEGTTRTDGAADTGTVDIGYHYPLIP